MYMTCQDAAAYCRAHGRPDLNVRIIRHYALRGIVEAIKSRDKKTAAWLVNVNDLMIMPRVRRGAPKRANLG